MAERVVTELVIDARGAVAGTAEYERAMNKASAAVEKVKAKTKDLRLDTNLPKSVDQVSRAFDRLKGSIDPVFRAQQMAEREMTRSLALVDSAVQRGVTTQVQAANTISALRQKQVSDITRVRQAQEAANRVVAVGSNANFNSANVAAQFQDIGITAMMGQSPLTIALQQGSQLSAVLGGQGAAGAVATLGAAFTSLVNPVSLAVIGLTAATAAAIQYGSDAFSSVETVDDAFTKHADTLSRIDQLYAGFSDRIGEYKDNAALLGALSRDSLEVMQAASREATQSFMDTLGEMATMGRGGRQFFDVEGIFEPFDAAIQSLQSSIVAGKPDFLAFQQQIERLVATDPANLRKVGDAILLAGQEAFRAAGGVDAASEAMERLGRTSAAAAANGNGALASLAQSAINAMSAVNSAVRSVYNFSGGTVNVARHTADASSAQWATLTAAQKEARYNGADWLPMMSPGGVVPTLNHINVADYLSGARAGGGPVSGGSTYLVGEQGPEIVTMAGAGNVSSASATAGILSGGASVLGLIEQNTFQTVEQLSRSVGYLETLENDGQTSISILRQIKDAIGKSQISIGGSSSAGSSGSSGGVFGSRRSGSGTTYNYSDPNSPYHFANNPSRSPGGPSYDPLADFLFNGNYGALGTIASRGPGMYDAIGPDATGNRQPTNVEIAAMLAASGPQLGTYGGGINITANSGFINDRSAGSFFGTGSRLAAGGMAAGPEAEMLRQQAIIEMCRAMGLAPPERFAKGGIANRPSIFGEAGPEAAVPLPDGRSIPVTIKQEGGSSKSITINVSVNARTNDDRRAGMEIADRVRQVVRAEMGGL